MWESATNERPRQGSKVENARNSTRAGPDTGNHLLNNVFRTYIVGTSQFGSHLRVLHSGDSPRGFESRRSCGVVRYWRRKPIRSGPVAMLIKPYPEYRVSCKRNSWRMGLAMAEACPVYPSPADSHRQSGGRCGASPQERLGASRSLPSDPRCLATLYSAAFATNLQQFSPSQNIPAV